MSEMNASDIELLRSDLGDGGWSLHAPESEGWALLASGEAERTPNGWSRPNAQDYAVAMAAWQRKR
jgi:esterase/lipase